MNNFSILTNVKRFSKKTISIQELVELVKNNPQGKLIEKIRSSEYHSDEYNRLKTQVACITPHAIVKGLKNSDYLKSSGYLYFDIDGFNNEVDRKEVADRLIKNYSISFLCKSVGGLGISFLVKVGGLDSDTFSGVYSYVRSIFINDGFNIDTGAGGILRKMIISSDDEVFYNEKVSFSINKVSLTNHLRELRRSKQIKSSKRRRHIKETDTFLESIMLIERSDLNISTETIIETQNYKIEKKDYYRIYIPKEIKDGTKHKLYTRVINALYYLNENITINEVYSFMFYINLDAHNRFNEFKLKSFCFNLCNAIKINGVRIKLGEKTIHLNKNKYNSKMRETIGRKLNSRIRRNESVEKIEEARMYCASENIKPTQKKIQEITGLSIATVKRNWTKEITNIDEYIKEIEKDHQNEQDEATSEEKEMIRDNKIKDVIDEDDFWADWNPIKHTDEVVDRDYGNGNPINGFIESVSFGKGKRFIA
jgi:hypothetical protein